MSNREVRAQQAEVYCAGTGGNRHSWRKVSSGSGAAGLAAAGGMDSGGTGGAVGGAAVVGGIAAVSGPAAAGDEAAVGAGVSTASTAALQPGQRLLTFFSRQTSASIPPVGTPEQYSRKSPGQLARSAFCWAPVGACASAGATAMTRAPSSAGKRIDYERLMDISWQDLRLRPAGCSRYGRCREIVSQLRHLRPAVPWRFGKRFPKWKSGQLPTLRLYSVWGVLWLSCESCVGDNFALMRSWTRG